MKVEVTIVIENTTPWPIFSAEYGLGMLVEVDGQAILFDTGMGEGMTKNLKAMGFNPDREAPIVISHGHFDHAGGLLKVLEYLGPRDIYIHPEALEPKFLELDEGKRAIGIPGVSEIEKMGGRFIFNEKPVEILPGVLLTGTIPRTNEFEDTGGKFVREREGILEDDLLWDDQAMVIKHPEGLIIVSGCAHSGFINTLEYAKVITGVQQIKAWIGGTHLMTAGPKRMEMTIDRLKAYDIEKIVVAHCTGFNASALLFNRFPNKVVKGESGAKFIFV